MKLSIICSLMDMSVSQKDKEATSPKDNNIIRQDMESKYQSDLYFIKFGTMASYVLQNFKLKK